MYVCMHMSVFMDICIHVCIGRHVYSYVCTYKHFIYEYHDTFVCMFVYKYT